jgi:hypothetical protein
MAAGSAKNFGMIFFAKDFILFYPSIIYPLLQNVIVDKKLQKKLHYIC